MAERDQESKEVMASAMRYVKSGDRADLEAFSLAALKKADLQLGNRDVGSGYRRAISSRVDELEEQAAKERSAKGNEVMQIKPTFYGISLDVKALIRKVRAWFATRGNK